MQVESKKFTNNKKSTKNQAVIMLNEAWNVLNAKKTQCRAIGLQRLSLNSGQAKY